MLIRNDIFRSANGRRWRLLAPDTFGGGGWAYPLNEAKGLPKYWPAELLPKDPESSALAEGLERPLISRRASERARVRAEFAWKRIEPLASNPAIYDVLTRGALVAERAALLPCSKQTLMKDLRRYWEGGQTKDALLGHYDQSGRKEKGVTAGRGSKPTKSHYSIYQLFEPDIEFIKQAAERYYLKDETNTMPDAYQRMLEDSYTYLDGNCRRIIKPIGERPTYRQFARILRAKFGIELRLRKRKGDKDFERDHRAKLGSVLEDCQHIGQYYDIDATIADVWLVSRKTRRRIIGKATIYLVIDRRSRLIVGFYIGLESASWEGALQAILSICEDKAALCKRYGVPYDPNDWPAHGMFPQQFLADRGELLGENSSKICTGLETTVTNVTGLRGDMKAPVEGRFKLIHCSIRDTAPGYEPPWNATKRRGKKYDQDASLNLDEFIGIVINAIIFYNRAPRKSYPSSPEFMELGVKPSPIALWTAELQRRAGLLTRFPLEHVRFKLLPQDKATVQREGILFNDLYYTCSEAIERGWFVRAGQGRFDLDISYDRRLVDSIYIHDPADRRNYFVATLLPKSSLRFAGMSFAEVRYYMRLAEVQEVDIDQELLQNRADFHARTDPVSKDARREMKAETKGKSRRSRRKDIRNDREAERRERRQEEAALPRPPAQTQAPADVISISRSKNSVSLPTEGPLPTTTAATPRPVADGAAPAVESSLQEKLRRKRLEMLNGNA